MCFQSCSFLCRAHSSLGSYFAVRLALQICMSDSDCLPTHGLYATKAIKTVHNGISEKFKGRYVNMSLGVYTERVQTVERRVARRQSVDIRRPSGRFDVCVTTAHASETQIEFAVFSPSTCLAHVQ